MCYAEEDLTKPLICQQCRQIGTVKKFLLLANEVSFRSTILVSLGKRILHSRLAGKKMHVFFPSPNLVCTDPVFFR